MSSALRSKRQDKGIQTPGKYPVPTLWEIQPRSRPQVLCSRHSLLLWYCQKKRFSSWVLVEEGEWFQGFLKVLSEQFELKIFPFLNI